MNQDIRVCFMSCIWPFGRVSLPAGTQIVSFTVRTAGFELWDISGCSIMWGGYVMARFLATVYKHTRGR